MTQIARSAPAGFHDERFSNAPANWRTAGAANVGVANRSQEDPRWTFFTLANNRKTGKAAVLWSKFLYPGDVTLEFYVANKMEGERGQPYTYARDINITICSDGSDLNKGYTFMFGGRNNEGSFILRNGVEVARHPAKIPTNMNYHRHWFAIKVEKIGGRLTFRVDRFFDGSSETAMIYEDPKPLSGNRIALWTYNHAISIARVRLSGEGGVETEDPSFVPGPLKTPLDEK